MNQTLFDFTKEYKDIELELIKNGGELTNELTSRFNVLDESVAHKVDSYKFIMEKNKFEVMRLKEKANEYLRLAKGYENVTVHLNLKLKATMFEMDTDELKGDEYRFKLSKTQPRLVVENETELLNDFKLADYWKMTKALDKKLIKDKIKEGFDIKGCKLEENFALKSYINKK